MTHVRPWGNALVALASHQNLRESLSEGYRAVVTASAMKAEVPGFGEIEVDGKRYDHDIVIEAGEVKKRKKGVSKRFRDEYGHTPLSATTQGDGGWVPRKNDCDHHALAY